VVVDLNGNQRTNWCPVHRLDFCKLKFEKEKKKGKLEVSAIYMKLLTSRMGNGKRLKTATVE